MLRRENLFFYCGAPSLSLRFIKSNAFPPIFELVLLCVTVEVVFSAALFYIASSLDLCCVTAKVRRGGVYLVLRCFVLRSLFLLLFFLFIVMSHLISSVKRYIFKSVLCYSSVSETYKRLLLWFT